jgi:aconitase A
MGSAYSVGAGGIEGRQRSWQPMSSPRCSVSAHRELREGTTATDLVLTVAELLRKTGWWAIS